MKIQEYRDYCTFSEYVRQTEEVYQKRSWVPKRIWNLVAQRHMTTGEISTEMKKAGETLLRNLLDEQEIFYKDTNNQ